MKKYILFLFVSIAFIMTACSGEETSKNDNSLSTDDVLTAFEEAGLSVPEPRDNNHNCDDLGCTALKTTEAVSIYQWPSEDEAKKNAEYFDYQSGTFTIRFNKSHTADGEIEYQPEPDKQSYKDVLDELVSSQE
ncbi:hypothetical protein ACTWP4_18680 [Gracilibacillus sp. D59]|uniref:hypothetical protein n=1 Tax=Gracilibacillus sp. D59 TaxID=3457434 RepID=UPI003FCC5382